MGGEGGGWGGGCDSPTLPLPPNRPLQTGVGGSMHLRHPSPLSPKYVALSRVRLECGHYYRWRVCPCGNHHRPISASNSNLHTASITAEGEPTASVSSECVLKRFLLSAKFVPDPLAKSATDVAVIERLPVNASCCLPNLDCEKFRHRERT